MRSPLSYPSFFSLSHYQFIFLCAGGGPRSEALRLLSAVASRLISDSLYALIYGKRPADRELARSPLWRKKKASPFFSLSSVSPSIPSARCGPAVPTAFAPNSVQATSPYGRAGVSPLAAAAAGPAARKTRCSKQGGGKLAGCRDDARPGLLPLLPRVSRRCPGGTAAPRGSDAQGEI